MVNETLKMKVIIIPPTRQMLKKVAIYCRVSTTHESQDESLDIQIKALKQYIAYNPNWELCEVYTDKDSGGNVFRPGFQKMILYLSGLSVVLIIRELEKRNKK